MELLFLSAAATEPLTDLATTPDFNIPGWVVLASLGVIAVISALGAYFISTKFNGNISQLVSYLATPILALIALLFGGDDSYRIRITLVATFLVVYVLSALVIRCIAKRKESKAAGTMDNGKDKGAIKIMLPLDHVHTIDKRFVEDIPGNVASIIHVSEEIRILTNSFIDSFSQLNNAKEKDESLRGYFLGMCYHLATLFDGSTRVHVRIQKDGKYQKYISTYAYQNGNMEPDQRAMKDMSYNNQMIAQSFEHECSLIKSINPTLHEDGSRKKWKNYLMFALPQITHNDKPVFSVGISITQNINERFYFLNYCAIESIIGRYIESALDDEKCSLASFIESYYFPKN